VLLMEAPTPLEPQLTDVDMALLLVHHPGKHDSRKRSGWPIWPPVSDPRP
jgi:hypothetical protein